MDNLLPFWKIIKWACFILIQTILIRHLVLWDTIFCFIYLAPLLYIRMDINRSYYMLLGFLTGFFMDLFYDTLGIHAAACVIMCFCRSYVVNLFTPIGGYDEGFSISIHYPGVRWFVTYSAILLFVHHLVLFYVEASSFNMFFYTFLKVVCSTIMSFSLIVGQQLLFTSNPSERSSYK